MSRPKPSSWYPSTCGRTRRLSAESPQAARASRTRNARAASQGAQCGAREGRRRREGGRVASEDEAGARGQAAVEADARPHVEHRRDRAEREQRPGAPRHARGRAAGERDRRGRGTEGDRARDLGQGLAAAPAHVEAQGQEPDGSRSRERRPERRAREGEGTRQQERRESRVAAEEALGQGGARVANALAPVEQPQPQRVARQEAGERRERQTCAGGRGGEDESQDRRLREKAPAAVLRRECHGLPGDGGQGRTRHGPILPRHARPRP